MSGMPQIAWQIFSSTSAGLRGEGMEPRVPQNRIFIGPVGLSNKLVQASHPRLFFLGRREGYLLLLVLQRYFERKTGLSERLKILVKSRCGTRLRLVCTLFYHNLPNSKRASQNAP